jgi:hypothetical protein
MLENAISQVYEERKKYFKQIYQGLTIQLNKANKDKQVSSTILKSVRERNFKQINMGNIVMSRRMSKTPPKLSTKFLSSERLRAITRSKSPLSGQQSDRKSTS